jgi:hypothetical protein
MHRPPPNLPHLPQHDPPAIVREAEPEATARFKRQDRESPLAGLRDILDEIDHGKVELDETRRRAADDLGKVLAEGQADAAKPARQPRRDRHRARPGR